MGFTLERENEYTEDQLKELGIACCVETNFGQLEYRSKDRKQGYYMKRLKNGKLKVMTRFTQYRF